MLCRRASSTSTPRLRATNAGFVLVVKLLCCFLPLVARARPCSESDIYEGYPLKNSEVFGAIRPYPNLLHGEVACTQLDLANADLKADEALLLARAVSSDINGDYKNLSVLTGIQSIVLDSVAELGDAATNQLAGAFNRTTPHPHNLTLALAAAGITHVGAAALATALRASSSTITRLRLDWNGGIGDAGASAIGRALVGNRMLGILGLQRCGIGDAGAVALAESLATAPTTAMHAATVAASGEAVAESMAAAVARAASSVRELYLEGNRIGALGTQALGVALRSARLEKLTLSLNPIGVSGARNLAEALRRNAHLVSLDLAHCEIGDGAVAISNALRKQHGAERATAPGQRHRARGRAGSGGQCASVALRSLNLRLNCSTSRLRSPARRGAQRLDTVRRGAQGALERAPKTELRLEDNHLLATAGAAPLQLITASTLAAVAAEVRPLAV